MSTPVCATAAAIAGLYTRSLAGERFFAHRLRTASDKELKIRDLQRIDARRLPLLYAASFGLLIGIFLTFLLRLGFYGDGFTPAYILLPIPLFLLLLTRRIKANIQGAYKNSPVISQLTEQLNDPTKAFFIFCSDRLYRAQDEITFLQRSFPHICALYSSLQAVHDNLKSTLNFDAGAVYIGVKKESEFWNENFHALHYFGYELDRIQLGIAYVIGNSASPREQDDLCDISRLRSMCTELREFVLKSTLIHLFDVGQIFALPKPINVLTGEYITSLYNDPTPFRALSRPI